MFLSFVFSSRHPTSRLLGIMMQICIWKFVGMTHFMVQNKTQMIPTALLTNVQELRTNKNLCKTAMEWHPIEIRLDFSGCQITAINLHNLQFFKKFWIEEKASTINGNKTNKSHDYIFSRFANKTICYSDWRRANALTHSYRAHTHTHISPSALTGSWARWLKKSSRTLSTNQFLLAAN